jgi:alkane 1-monooxygenase
MCFALPVVCLGFLLTAPHVWWMSLLWILPLSILDQLDRRSVHERSQPDESLLAWPFDLIVYLLAGLHLLILFLAVRLFSMESIWSVDALVTVILVGINSGVSGIIVAHELIHRRSKRRVLFGRFILCTLMHEHFFTEHIRGHHVRVGTLEDATTARFGESFLQYYRRAVFQQLLSAWRLDRTRVIQGLIVEWAIAFAVLGYFGFPSFLIYLVLAWRAIFILEIVQYFEHWGLTRSGKKASVVDSWDTDSWMTLYSLVGLSRHADHHASASRPYQQLRFHQESPQLPLGYISLMAVVLFNNKKYMHAATEELRRRKLGPFAEELAA